MGTLPKISVVFVTFNRMATLRATYDAFLVQTDYPRERLELIVTDDASPAAVQAEIRSIPFDHYCLAQRRGGLGANANRGIAAATGEHILQLQDDWVCRGPPGYLRRAVDVLETNADIGMVILNQHPGNLRIRSVRLVDGHTIRVYENDPQRSVRQVGEHAYTDWPQLKRKSFVQAIGPYSEGAKMWETELEFSQRVNAQTEFFIADIAGMTVFEHIGAELSFNTGPWKARLARRIERLPLGGAFIRWYRAQK